MRVIDKKVILSENPKEEGFIIALKFEDGRMLVAHLPKIKMEIVEHILEYIEYRTDGEQFFTQWLRDNGIKG